MTFFGGGGGATEIQNSTCRSEALRKSKEVTGVWPVCLKKEEKAKQKNKAAPIPRDLSYGGCLCPSRETHVLEGNKEQEGKKTQGKWGKEWQEKKMHETGTRYSKAKNVLKTTC